MMMMTTTPKPPARPRQNSEDERKFNGAVIDVLLRLWLLSLPDFDSHLAKLLQQTAGRNAALSELVLHLLRVSVLQLGAVSFADLGATMDVLGRLAAGNGPVMQVGPRRELMLQMGIVRWPCRSRRQLTLPAYMQAVRVHGCG